jgi:hypothetical protein
MFRSISLPILIQFTLMFYNDKPVDWLLDHVVDTKVCKLEDRVCLVANLGPNRILMSSNLDLLRIIDVSGVSVHAKNLQYWFIFMHDTEKKKI